MDISKIHQSIKLIHKLNIPENPYYLGFSGGKDSLVLYDLAVKSGVLFFPEYSNTTIDPPGTIQFIKQHYPLVKIINPKYSFYKLVERKGLPTRLSRFCCYYLKENAGKGHRTLLGIRMDESFQRSLYEPEQCDTRRGRKNTVSIRPILNWSESDIWEYIKYYNLPYLKFYDQPYSFKRHGCVGCPMAGAHVQIREYKIFPRYVYALLKAIKKNMILKPNNTFARSFKDEYEVFDWWLSGQSIKQYLLDRKFLLFPSDLRNNIENLFPKNNNSE